MTDALSRRDLVRWTGALGLAAALPTLAACDSDSSATLVNRVAGDPDVTLTDQALAAELAMLALLEDAADGQALRHRLRATIAVHTRHVDLLSPAASATPSAEAGPGLPHRPGKAGRQQALRRLAHHEQQLTATHRSLAMQARSGPLARVLGSMSAAAAQQAVILGGAS